MALCVFEVWVLWWAGCQVSNLDTLHQVICLPEACSWLEDPLWCLASIWWGSCDVRIKVRWMSSRWKALSAMNAMIGHVSWQCFVKDLLFPRPWPFEDDHSIQNITKYSNYWKKKRDQSAIIVFEPSNPPSNSCWDHSGALRPSLLEAAGFFQPSRGILSGPDWPCQAEWLRRSFSKFWVWAVRCFALWSHSAPTKQNKL